MKSRTFWAMIFLTFFMASARAEQNTVKLIPASLNNLYSDLNQGLDPTDSEYFSAFSPQDLYEFAQRYFYDVSISENEEKGFYFLELSAEQGYAPALYHWGMLALYAGYSPEEMLLAEQNAKKALLRIKNAAYQGYAPAQYQMGLLYSVSDSILDLEQDIDLAVYWLRLSAENGFEPAQEVLESVLASIQFFASNPEFAPEFETAYPTAPLETEGVAPGVSGSSIYPEQKFDSPFVYNTDIFSMKNWDNCNDCVLENSNQSIEDERADQSPNSVVTNIDPLTTLPGLKMLKLANRNLNVDELVDLIIYVQEKTAVAKNRVQQIAYQDITNIDPNIDQGEEQNFQEDSLLIYQQISTLENTLEDLKNLLRENLPASTDSQTSETLLKSIEEGENIAEIVNKSQEEKHSVLVEKIKILKLEKTLSDTLILSDLEQALYGLIEILSIDLAQRETTSPFDLENTSYKLGDIGYFLDSILHEIQIYVNEGQDIENTVREILLRGQTNSSAQEQNDTSPKETQSSRQKVDEERDAVIARTKARYMESPVCKEQDRKHNCYDICKDIYPSTYIQEGCFGKSVAQIENLEFLHEEALDSSLDPIELSAIDPEDFKVYISMSLTPLKKQISMYDRKDAREFFLWLINSADPSIVTTLVKLDKQGRSHGEYVILRELLRKLSVFSYEDRKHINSIYFPFIDLAGDRFIDTVIQSGNKPMIEWVIDYINYQIDRWEDNF